MLNGSIREGFPDCCGHILYAPVDECAVSKGGIGQQAEFVTAHIESDIERLVEVRVDTERC